MQQLGLIGKDGTTKKSPVLSKLCKDKAVGPDFISDRQVHENQKVRDELFQYVYDIYNGNTPFPQELRKSYLTLLIKDKDNPSTLDNLRPIAM